MHTIGPLHQCDLIAGGDGNPADRPFPRKPVELGSFDGDLTGANQRREQRGLTLTERAAVFGRTGVATAPTVSPVLAQIGAQAIAAIRTLAASLDAPGRVATAGRKAPRATRHTCMDMFPDANTPAVCNAATLGVRPVGTSGTAGPLGSLAVRAEFASAVVFKPAHAIAAQVARRTRLDTVLRTAFVAGGCGDGKLDRGGLVVAGCRTRRFARAVCDEMFALPDIRIAAVGGAMVQISAVLGRRPAPTPVFVCYAEALVGFVRALAFHGAALVIASVAPKASVVAAGLTASDLSVIRTAALVRETRGRHSVGATRLTECALRRPTAVARS